MQFTWESMQEALDSIQVCTDSVQTYRPVTPTLERGRQEDQGFKVVFGHTVSWRPAWACLKKMYSNRVGGAARL